MTTATKRCQFLASDISDRGIRTPLTQGGWKKALHYIASHTKRGQAHFLTMQCSAGEGHSAGAIPMAQCYADSAGVVSCNVEGWGSREHWEKPFAANKHEAAVASLAGARRRKSRKRSRR